MLQHIFLLLNDFKIKYEDTHVLFRVCGDPRGPSEGTWVGRHVTMALCPPGTVGQNEFEVSGLAGPNS